MKPTSLIISALLLSALCALVFSQSYDVFADSHGPDECCFDYVTKIKYESAMISYKNTHPSCSLKAVIFTRRDGAKLCADPSKEWVQRIMKGLEMGKN
ncbi:C-C motif chemokine 3-like [Megalops cyprinoides]|uniref:C-C motif chemokine 3-like n=1 Tax=Megalops cyprinoides TaxID=118141 RepID=UPI0018654FF0|nr:C-C motif chemokine 3-like [Megalops cyprinoides]